ncbi:uncharacterized protein DEA37_0013815 [Paragonimus westermani]|uniref:Uncharacterized protein n=1 Tax=Paragonimus westermani TaxID=34504 RepID=A0A5J4N7C2_9TREM|nr:uncharacterized protein DEA37_0013815 [Paragonimus westermani]
MGRALKISFVVIVVVAAILGIVALGLNRNISNSSQRGSRFQCLVAFNIIAVILLLIAAILYLVMMFVEEVAGRILVIITFTLVAVGLVCYIIACACGSIGTTFPEWLLSALWATLAAVALEVVLALFTSDD